MQDQVDSYGWEVSFELFTFYLFIYMLMKIMNVVLQCIFRTPLNNYDAVILVHREKLSYPERLLFPSELNHGIINLFFRYDGIREWLIPFLWTGKLVAQGKASNSFQPLLLTTSKTKDPQDQLYINFDPLMCYIKHLEASNKKKIFKFIFKIYFNNWLFLIIAICRVLFQTSLSCGMIH